ncbi:hypothetical protein JSO59_003940 [Riemerella anatipestifer]|uniref:hypothetical protein n=1 Tax=Riemerella anatipestifer TaxID=34085 RepID=UPI002A8A70EC|nr:hypothetical protein [Riemerella anatipestifer]
MAKNLFCGLSDKAQRELEILRGLYSQDELEDCLFSVFQDAYLYEDCLAEEEREKRAMLHSLLRKVLKDILTLKTEEICTTETQQI